MQLVHLFSRPLVATLCLLVGLTSAALAQTPDTLDQVPTAPTAPTPPTSVKAPADTTEIVWRNSRFIIIKDEDGKRLEVISNDDVEVKRDDEDEAYDYDYENKETRHYERSNIGLLGLDLGITNYYSAGKYGSNAIVPELTVKEFRPGSHVALHLLPTRVGFDKRGYVNLKTAITIDWNNYYYTNDITLNTTGESLAFDTTGTNFSKNKLMVRYAQIPLMLNVDTDPDGNDGISISVGGYVGLLWGSRTKQVSDEFGTVKIPGEDLEEFFLNPYRYGLIARVDFKWFDIYVHYNLSPLFAENRGPDTQTFMAGVNLIDF
jgi:hypothetical protein